MKQYLDIAKAVLEHGEHSDNRTGIPTIRIPYGKTFEYDMSDGTFPLLTTKKMPIKSIAAELELFLKGYTDKQFLKDRGCKIWNEWAREATWKPLFEERLNEAKKSGAELTDEKTKEIQNSAIDDTRDLGPIYGWQWRHWNGEYVWNPEHPEQNYNINNPGFDQLKYVIETAKKNPNDRRLIVSAWNPAYQKEMALPPCHYCWQILILNNKLNLIWNQRSCDIFLGVPFNIASYALLLLLMAKELNCKPGILRGNLGDVHIYQNHIDQIKEQLTREPKPLPNIEIPDENWNGILNWSAKDIVLKNYEPYASIKGQVAR